jgi:hypothetical protein
VSTFKSARVKTLKVNRHFSGILNYSIKSTVSVNQLVVGSIPTAGAKSFKNNSLEGFVSKNGMAHLEVALCHFCHYV